MPAVDLEQYFAMGVLNHDACNGSASGIEPLRLSLAEMRTTLRDLRITTEGKIVGRRGLFEKVSGEPIAAR